MVQRSRHIKGFSTRRHKKNTSIKRIETQAITTDTNRKFTTDVTKRTPQ